MGFETGQPARKAFVIGLDSATFDILLPMARKGLLPNLARLLNEGAWGELESTFPPVTPPAWSSFMTGKNPGKHGVFDFYAPPSVDYERQVLNARSIRARTLGRMLSDLGARVGLVNVPITHPPEKIEGFVIPGLQYAFSPEHGFTHPPELLQEIQEKFGAYEVAFGDEKSLYTNELDTFIERWERIHSVRTKTVLYLMASRPWNLFMVVFSSIDMIQHHFWKFHDASHPLHDALLRERYGPVIEKFYQKIDASVGEILSRLDEETVVLVASDHGAGPELQSFYLNRWLMREGLLKVRARFYPLVRFKFPHLFYKVLGRLRCSAISWTIPMSLYRALKDRVDPRDGLRLAQLIDWARTQAFAGNHTEQAIYINVRGREPAGVVEPGEEYERLRDRIIDRLAGLKDPATGERAVDGIWKKEELYHGPYLPQAADIYFLMRGGSIIARKELQYRELFRPPDKTSGTHRMEGVFVIAGRGVQRGARLKGLKIYDAAPTLLYSIGLPVPDDMDGRVAVEAFEKGWVEAHPIRHIVAPPQDTDTEGGIYGAEDAEKIRETLKSLGYMG